MKQGRSLFVHRIATISGIMLAGVCIAWLAVLGLGIAIALDGFRQPIETAVSRALGRTVHIDGALELIPTLGPTIVARDVRIAGPAGHGDLFHAGRVTLRLAPVALLRGEPRSVRLLIEDATIDLAGSAAVARGMERVEQDAAHAPGYPRLLSAGALMLSHQPELRELTLRRVVLNDRAGDAGQPHRVELDEVSIQTRPGQAVELIVRGRFQQQPYSIDLTGGELANLLTPTRPWPVRARVSIADTRLLLNGKLEALRQGLVLPFELQVERPEELAMLAARLSQAPLAGQLSLQPDQGLMLAGGELRLPALDAVLRFGAGAASDTDWQSDRAGETRDGRSVHVPLGISVAGVPFRGQLIVAGQDDPVAELTLSAAGADAGGLVSALTGTTGIRGRFRHIGFQARVHGGMAGLVNRVALALQVNGATLSYGNAAGERPVAVAVDELALSLPAGGAMTMHASGSLLDEPLAVELTAGGLESLLAGESWPVTLSARGGGAVLDVSGPVAVARGKPATSLHVSLYGKRIGDLAAWLGVSPCAASSYTLRGQLVLAEDIGRLQFLELITGGSRLNGDLDWSGDDSIARLHAVLHFEDLDPADFAALAPLVRQTPDAGTARGIALDMPVLPRPVELANADIDLQIGQILLELVDITRVSLSARIRDGRLQRSPFHAHIAGASFQGYLDPASAETGVVFENEDTDNAGGGRLDRLFSKAVRWIGSTAVVPLRWIFNTRYLAVPAADCGGQGADAGD